MGDPRGQRRALFAPTLAVLLALVGLANPAGATTPAGTAIDNVARGVFGASGEFQATSNVVSFTVEGDADDGGGPVDAVASPCADPALRNGAEIAGAFSVCENTTGALVLTLDPPQSGNTVRISDPRFVYDTTTGELRLAPGVALDREIETFVDLTLEIVDVAGFGETEIFTGSFRILVGDLNEAPTVSVGDAVVSAGVAGADVDGVTVADPDAGDTVTATVDDPRFEVVAGRLKLADGVSIAPGSGPIPLVVTVIDAGGLTATASLTVRVREAIVAVGCGETVRNAADVSAASFSVCENAPGAVVAQLSPASGAGLVTSDPRFVVDATGRVRLAEGVALDFEATPALSLTLLADPDQAPTGATAAFVGRVLAITVGDINEAPSIVVAPGGARVTVGGTDRIVEGVSFVDPDAGDVVTVEHDDGRFVFENGILRLRDDRVITQADLGATTLALRAVDTGGLTDTAEIALSVTLPVAALQPVRCASANGPDALGEAAAGQFTVCENVPGAVIAGFSNVPAGATFTTSDARIGVTPAGVVRLLDGIALDREAESSIELTVTLNRADGSSRPFPLTVRVDDVNEAPSITYEGSTEIAEGLAGAVLGPVPVSDPDVGDVLTVTVDDDRFEIVDGRLKLRDGVALTFDETPGVDLVLTVTDAGGLQRTLAITVAVLDDNEAPAVEDLTLNVASNAANGQVIGQVVASDDDVGDVLSFAIVDGNEAGIFAISAIDGLVRVADRGVLGLPGTVHELRVRVTDDNAGGAAAGRLSTEATVRITVVAGNTAPFVEPQRFEPVAEGSPAGTVLGVVGGLDVHQPLRFRISGGDPRGIFTIEPTTGRITVARPELFDFEAAPEITLQVSVTDSHPTVPLTSVAQITIPLVDVNEPPRLITTTVPVPDGLVLGDRIGPIRFSDPDTVAGDEARIEIVGGDPNGALTIDPVTGEIRVNNPERIAFDENGVARLVVRLSDTNATGSANGRQVVEAVIELRRRQGNRAPTAIRLDDTIVEAGVAGAVVGTLSTVDPDIGDTHSYLTNDPRFVVERDPADPARLRLRLAPGNAVSAGDEIPVAITTIDRAGLSLTRTFIVHTGTLMRAPAQISFLQAPLSLRGPASSGGADLGALALGARALTAFDVGQTQCSIGSPVSGQFTPTLTPRSVVNAPLPVPGSIELIETESYKVGEPLFVRVIDLDGNRDPAVRDTVVVDLRVEASQDREMLRIQETGPDTGTFVGYIQSTSNMNGPYDCILWVGGDVELTATYFDEDDGTDTAAAAALVDPFGFVFSSDSGRRIDGATVRLVNADTGQLAAVFGDEPFADYPAEIESGGTVTDAGGVFYDFPAGAYRFPFVNPGRFRLEVDAPNRFTFPSVRADGELSPLDGGPYTLRTGSRGETFVIVAGPAVRIDLPLDVVPLAPTPSLLEVFTLAPPGAGVTSTAAGTAADARELDPGAVARIRVDRTQCLVGAGERRLDLPSSPTGGFIELPGRLALTPASAFNTGDDVFLRLTDGNADRDPFLADTIDLTLRADAEDGETERLRLTETGPSTGIFTGHLPSTSAALVGADCALGADRDRSFTVSYVDANDPADTASRSLTFDPSARVFDSLSGELVDGASVTIVDDATGAPADVFALDGVTPFPATVVVGGRATDDAGRVIEFREGRFRFPVVPPGTYRYEVMPRSEHLFPSRVPEEALQQLEGAPYRLDAGSRGEPFKVLPGQVNVRDVPLDPVSADIFISKKSLKPVVAIGDFTQYEITVQNAGGADAGSITLVDTLPPGFRYQRGSARIDGERMPGVIAREDGRTLEFPLTGLTLGNTASFRYVVEVAAGARLGTAVNRVTAVGDRVRSSNTAEAEVRVREDLLRSKATLVGRVYDGACDVPAEERTGLANVRIYMEDGTYVVTDQSGRWHIEGVEPGTHVVQLDLASLPPTHEVVSCVDNARFAGSDFSQFVDVQGGSLWRADFHVALRAPLEGSVGQRLAGRVNGDRILVRADLRGAVVPVAGLTQIFMLPEGYRYVRGSSRVGGEPVDDPQGAEGTALTYRLGDRRGDWTLPVSLMIERTDAPLAADAAIKSMAMFQNHAGERVRLPVTELGLAVETGTTAGAALDFPLDDPRSRARLERLLDGAGDSELLILAPTEAGDARRITSGELRALLEQSGGTGSAQGDDARRVRLAAREETRVRLSKDTTTVSEAKVSGPRPGTEVVSDLPEIPEIPDQNMPRMGIEDLRAFDEPTAVVWPPEGALPRIRATWFAVKHPLDQRVELEVNGVRANPLQFDGVRKFPDADLALSVWRHVSIEDGDNEFVARILDGREPVSELRRTIRFSGGAFRAELVPEASRPTADGVTPPVIAVRLFDESGSKVRPGTTGRYRVDAPYRAYESEELQAERRARARERNPDATYVVAEDGIAYLRLQPTDETGEVTLRLQLARDRERELRARLVPEPRDWVLVGFGEGTVGYRTLSDNMEAARASGLEDELWEDGRVAFFAKGTVKGKYLLTMAYDTDKVDEGALGDQIDPDRFYTLYGDGSQQRFDAESQRKLYLKIERGTFSALFGDFDTGLTVTELTRYSRRLTGFQSEYDGEEWGWSVFGSEADQAFLRDDLRGDGTSGLYRLSGADIIPNSERVRIEVRDRLRTQDIVEERSLQRFVDYNIDYLDGTILFKEPVPAQDEALNPVFVVVEYETTGQGSGRTDLVAGGRVVRKFAEVGLEVAATAVHDGTTNAESSLGGLDARWRVDDRTEVRAEVAYTDSESADASADGVAYLVEAERFGDGNRVRGWVREQEAGFGVGQQFSGGQGMRRMGVTMEQFLGGDFRIESEATQERNLDTDDVRRILDGALRWRSDRSRAGLGARMVDEQRDAGDRQSELLTGDLGRTFFDGILSLGLDGEYDLAGGRGENPDYPTRVGVNGDLRVLDGVHLQARHELSFADQGNTEDTTFGIRMNPWSGADLRTGIAREISEDRTRLFGTTSLAQRLRLGEHWSIDAGADREYTLDESTVVDSSARDPGAFNPANPPAFGSQNNNDFTSLFVGARHQREVWEASTRVEYRHADSEERWNLLGGYAHQLDDGRIISAQLQVFSSDAINGDESLDGDLRLAAAWRPTGGAWTLLDRLDLVFQEAEGVDRDSAQRKIVNNLNLNFRPNLRNELSLIWGIKYVLDEFDGEAFSGVTDLYGAEYRYDITRRFDIGVHANALHSWNTHAVDYRTGLSVGVTPMHNVWVSVGYNFDGFRDEDFEGADFMAHGPFLKFRFKVDQHSLRDYLGEMPFHLD